MIVSFCLLSWFCRHDDPYHQIDDETRTARCTDFANLSILTYFMGKYEKK